MENFEKFERKQEQETVVFRFEDFRDKDLSKENFSNISIDVLQTIEFDTETIWPEKGKLPKNFDPEKLLEESKNPGLGIKELHEQGINGQGVVVAIIDQRLDVSHPEYQSSIADYVEYGEAVKEGTSMHGPAVASLFVGKDCGVAPGAKLVYKAVPSGRSFLLEAQALDDIIEKNKTASQNEKVRVVSCSIGYMLGKPEPGVYEWIKALKKAKESGIFVVDVGGNQIDISFGGGGSPDSKNDFESYLSWLREDEGNEEHLNEIKKEIVVPSDYRTMASSWNKEGQYMYNGRGGISWSVPYLAGLFALILQVNPNLKREEIAEIINESAVVNKKGFRIVNPKGIIDLAKERIKS